MVYPEPEARVGGPTKGNLLHYCCCLFCAQRDYLGRRVVLLSLNATGVL